MNSPCELKKNLWSWKETILMALAFALWMWMFRDYLLGKMAIFDDAVSYYDHVKFYLDNIRRGVFPLWDPLWFCGAANSFFLQRMGCFNPFLLLTNVFHGVGIPYTISYLLYLAVYYFIGCLGFYLLAKRLTQDRLCAFAAFLFLLFSALGTRLFDSYMILMFTPIAWFFYFLTAFSQEPRRYSFVGMVVALLAACTTYIPFYFFLVVSSFLIFYVLLYGNTVPSLLKRYVQFARQNKLLIALCAVILLASLIPGYLFFKAAGGKGEFVMPNRNTDQSVGSVLGVTRQDSSNSWSILEEFVFAGYYYSDITLIKFAILYVPLAAYLVFFLGFLTRINKKAFFLFLWAAGLLLLCIPIASPVYAFLYQHVFFFKYFRNLHFLLWVALLPMFAMFLGLQLKSFLSWRPATWGEKLAGCCYVSVVHGALAWYLFKFQFPLMSSYAVLILSYVFFLWYLFGSLRSSQNLAVLLLLVITALEPMEVYTHLSQNTKPYFPYAYSYDYTDMKFHYTRFDNDVDMAFGGIFPEDPQASTGKRLVQPSGSIYYAAKSYGYLAGNIDYYILKKYRKHRFILYDEVARLDEGTMDFLAFETSLAENRNVAFVSTDDPDVLAAKSQGRHSYYAQPLEGDSENFQVTAFDSNHVKIHTKFPEPKFLVYNDSFHTQWRVSIDGKRVPLVRSNVAFKGVWIPPGERTVEFSFGSIYLWAIYLFLFAAFNGLLILLIVLWRRDCRPKSQCHEVLP